MRVAILSSYIPQKCGIATFTHSLWQNIPNADIIVVAENYDSYPNECKFIIRKDEAEDYKAAAKFVYDNYDLVVVQHEFGIFGGPDGEYLLEFINRVKLPVITTCHTILDTPSENQKRVFEQLIFSSNKVIVMAEKAKELLRDFWNYTRVEVIQHGVPKIPFVQSNSRNLLTFGLLSPNKGIEVVIKAMPEIVKQNPDVCYQVVGQTHPNLLKHEGEKYRDYLIQLAKELGVEKNVCFINEFVDDEKLIHYLKECAIYITPYLNEKQVTSGTLAYAAAAGRCIISTPYWHAQELLADRRGLLINFNNSDEVSNAVNYLFRNDDDLIECEYVIRNYMKNFTWDKIGLKYEEVFKSVY